MKLAYIILAHQHPNLIIRLVKRLIANGSVVVLHYDLDSGTKDYDLIQQQLADAKELVLYANRIKVGWGEWSIVHATLNALNQLNTLETKPNYVHLMSGMDYPIRSEDELKDFLIKNLGKEFIQAVDINYHRWITDGLNKERFEYRHYFNWQHHPKIFDWNYYLQRKILPKRKFPKGLTPHMGSQWWTLTWSTCEALLERSKDIQLIKFFQTVWIPDEMYIQTLVAAIVGKSRITGKCLTLYQFNHNGVPLIFTNGHQDYLTRQPFFFARKISPYADQLRDRLDNYHTGQIKSFSLPKENFGITTKEYEFFLKKYELNKQKGHRVIGLVRDAWYGDLEWNDKIYYIITGGSLSELKIVQEFLNQQTGIICHGNLFSPQRINFLNDAEEYAGFNSEDITLRDHSRQNFLVQLIRRDLDKIVAFLLPFGEADSILEVCLWDKNSRIIALKTNPFLLYQDHEKEINQTAILTNEQKFSRFWEIYHTFRKQHEEFWQLLHSAWKSNLEICLYKTELSWTNQLLNFIHNMERESFDKGNENSLESILTQNKLIKRMNQKEYNIRLSEFSYREKNLSDNNKPYYILVGGSKIELKLIQNLLNQRPGIICHGDLFSINQINFAQDAKKYAGFNYQDTALRDYNKENFLFHILEQDKDKLVTFWIPFNITNKILDFCLWDKNARIIPLKTNPFLLYREYEEESNISAIWSIKPENKNIENPKLYLNKLRSTAFIELFRKFYQQHQNFWYNLHNAHSKNWEICLYDRRKTWITELLDFIYRMEFEQEQELFDAAKQIFIVNAKNNRKVIRYINQNDYDNWINQYNDLYGETRQLAKIFFDLTPLDQNILAEYVFFRGNTIWQNMKFLEKY